MVRVANDNAANHRNVQRDVLPGTRPAGSRDESEAGVQSSVEAP